MSNTLKTNRGTMYITLKQFLARIGDIERSKPRAERRKIPSIVKLAEAVGIHPITLSDIANNNIELFNLKTGAAIIDELRRQGFDCDVPDLIAYRPAENSE